MTFRMLFLFGVSFLLLLSFSLLAQSFQLRSKYPTTSASSISSPSVHFLSADTQNEEDTVAATTTTSKQGGSKIGFTYGRDDDDKGAVVVEERFYLDPIDDQNKPAGAFLLACNNFVKQGAQIVKQSLDRLGIRGKSDIDESECLPGCLNLVLSNEAVTEAERIREARPGGKVETNAASRALYDIGCNILDTFFDGRPIQRFWFLETIARIPYFSYVSMLHLYETFGWWREPELRKVHNAQEWNELHHLLIMEALGGNKLWSDRFFGYHAAIFYYWAVNALFLFSPRAAYEFMELLESHAVDTYSTFVRENEERLKKLPPPEVGRSYYTGADLYIFDDFQVSKKVGSRRPPCDSLYDIFKNISEDEGEHVRTMQACQDYAKVGDIVVSPHASGGDSIVSEAEKRKTWKEWADAINTGDLEDFITREGGDY